MVFLWYILVVFNLLLFVLALIYKNLILTLAAFGLALVLERFSKNIPLPKLFNK